jgi:hypothetical protein
VSGLDAQWNDEVDIIRLNLLGPIGRLAAREFGVYVVPATLLFDKKGSVIERQHGIPDQNVLNQALISIVKQ